MVEINPQYKSTIPAIRKVLDSQKEVACVALQDFLTSASYEELQQEIKALVFRNKSVPSEFSYEEAVLSAPLKKRLSGIVPFLDKVIGKKRIEWKLLRFSKNDYTILKDNSFSKGINIIIDCSSDWKDAWGGMLVYMYEDKQQHVPPKVNTLTIVQKKLPAQWFMSFLNHYAKGKRVLIIGSTK